MPADDTLAEALIRIEHKLDIVLRALKVPVLSAPPLVPHGSYTCPLCKQQVYYQPDSGRGVTVRKCGCTTGLVPVNLELLKAPQQGRGDTRERGNEEQVDGAENSPPVKTR